MSVQRTDLAHADWELWSTTARVVVTDPAALPAARALVEQVCADVEAACSRFRDDSELAGLGPADERGEVELSPVLADLVDVALRAAHDTDGAVDPTVAAALRGLGYDRDIRLVESGAGLRAEVRPVPGHRRVSLTGRRLRVPAGADPSTLLDLGATAKARAADLAAAAVASRLGVGVLVALGGDVATAGPDPAEGWQVLVQDTPDDPAQQVRLAAGWALATSSTVRRAWQRAEGRQHHIVDPATGRSAASPWRSVTVTALTCVAANAATTAAVVKGAAAPAWLDGLGLAARLVDLDGTVHRVGSWPRDHAGAAA